MVKSKQTYPGNDRRPAWLIRSRALLRPHNLIIIIPVFISLVFGSMYSMQQNISYNNQQKKQQQSHKKLPTLSAPDGSASRLQLSPIPAANSSSSAPASLGTSAATTTPAPAGSQSYTAPAPISSSLQGTSGNSPTPQILQPVTTKPLLPVCQSVTTLLGNLTGGLTSSLPKCLL